MRARAARQASGLSATARSLLSARTARGVAVEAGWVAAHLAIYPLGLLGEKARDEARRLTVADLPPLQRALHVGDVEAAGTPILLVHGIFDNRSVFALLRRGLRRRGFGTVATMNYSPFTIDLRDAATLLAQRVEALCAQTGYDRIHVVGHSLGGLVARYYVQRLGGDARVHTLVTLGTPHAGTHAARVAPPYLLVRQLRPGSALLAELDEPAPGCRTRVLAFWSDIDPMVVPQRNARVEHPDLTVRNVLVRGVGHLSLPIDGTVVHTLCTALAHLDQHGDTLTAGVTAIGPDGAVHPEREPAGRRRDDGRAAG